jgi:hypothetical protein
MLPFDVHVAECALHRGLEAGGVSGKFFAIPGVNRSL